MDTNRTPAPARTTSDEPPLSAGSDDAEPGGTLPAAETLATTRPIADLNTLRQDPQWQDWRWQIRHRIRTFEQLAQAFPALQRNTRIAEVAAKYPLAITPYYLSAILKPDYSDPVFSQAVPQSRELLDPAFLHADPLEEEQDMPVPGLIHRYRDRALLMTTTMCSMYCRHCTRKRMAGTRECTISVEQLRRATEYLKAHPEITDVILSGGDPLTMSTSLLERIVQAVRAVPSVEIIRIGTRTPVVLPQRITDELVKMLAKYHPVWINTHFNHPQELTPESRAALAKLANAGIPLGNQSVLLRGINDDPRVMETLCRGLVRERVRPYYLFQCDLVRGVEHFRTPISRGIEIMEYLRGRLSGLAVPTYVVDAPHGGGKLPLLPNYIVSVSPTHTVLRNFEGMLINYPEPMVSASRPEPPPAASRSPGVWELATGHQSAILPAGNRRLQRRPAARKSAAASNNGQQTFLWA